MQQQIGTRFQLGAGILLGRRFNLMMRSKVNYKY